ncbi:hypothetical protein LF1_58180 [Rubripirellula obstinata]|uniref:Uncharacterized protein n=1 Tax=Rubripirellula obstinata TaxID=406547 RepID=A0A5B1C731_9BACT|nr:transposase zinc-binding domain-containing protein [Rubripirellula obstinata]KAA1256887.1 hypothetical protein LF1_58180 [Rubripirellula obstinata]
MSSVALALRVHAPEYLERFGDRVPLGHRKVLGCITRCRTGELGGVQFQCDSCGSDHWVGRSCGNRHCPNCQKNKTSDWLAKQTDRLLPVHHFLVTFTVPEELRSLLRSNQREGYAAIFACGSETIRDVGSATRSLKGCELGFFGVLHTWGRDPTVYHPHVHFVVPGEESIRNWIVGNRPQRTSCSITAPHVEFTKRSSLIICVSWGFMIKSTHPSGRRNGS